MPNLKVLLFNWRCPKHPQAGGAEKATYEIAKRWVSKGNEVHLISGGFPGGKSTDEIDGIRITRLGGKLSIYPKSILHYCTNFRGKYDIVVDEINTIPFLTPLFVNKPHVGFIHQLAANVLYEELPKKQATILSYSEPHVLSLYKRTHIFTSQSTKDDLMEMGFKENRITVINYGVDHTLYHPGDHKSPYPHVFYLGRLKRFKGVHLLIKSMAEVVRAIPDVKLSIVGSGDLDYTNELHNQVRKLNLINNVSFYELGLHDSLFQKIRIMQEAWVLVFPSAHEGFGLVVVEANACGTPTIATNVPGLRETVKDNETGILPQRNVEALAFSIIQILSD